MFCNSENITSAAVAERAGPASLAQAIRQGRSWLAALHLRRREGGGELAIHILGRDVGEGRHRDLRQGEDLQEQRGQFLERRGDVLSMGTAVKSG
jgi:hypothetical protein